MFIVDKYKPRSMAELMFHLDIMNKLQNISHSNNMPNIILYGPKSSGKKTLVNIFLEMIYDKTVHDTIDTPYTISCTKTMTEILIKQSNFHIVIDRNNNTSDKYIVQDIIKEYTLQSPMYDFLITKRPFKTVLIMNVDKLSYYAQTSLRRTMEIYSKTCRFIMISTSLSKVIDPLRSRCLCIRVPRPTKQQIFTTMEHILISENLKMTLYQINNIINTSDMDIKKCLWKIDLYKSNIEDNIDLDNIIISISKLVLEYKINNIKLLRSLIYKLLTTTISNSDIIQLITHNILLNIEDDTKKYLIIYTACKYDHLLATSRRDIKQLEPFIIDIFCILHSPGLVTIS